MRKRSADEKLLALVFKVLYCCFTAALLLLYCCFTKSLFALVFKVVHDKHLGDLVFLRD
jgi:hypothetical protein